MLNEYVFNYHFLQLSVFLGFFGVAVFFGLVVFFPLAVLFGQDIPVAHIGTEA
jgi:hypothetical protein